MSDGQHGPPPNTMASTVYPEPSEKLDPRSRRVWLIGDLIGAVVITAIVAGVMFLLDWWLDFGRIWSIGVPVVLGLVQLAWAIIRPEIEFRQWRFEIREDEVDLLHGVITRTRQVIPMSRIQHVDTERGPIQRRYGLSTVKFFTAAGAMEIPQLSAERADAVRDQIATLAKVHDDI
jgi:membrane protein YdbS with pleckstrin-like domain